MVKHMIKAAALAAAVAVMPLSVNAQTVAQQKMNRTGAYAKNKVALPTPAQQFLNKYYARVTVVSSKKDGLRNPEYEVKLANGTEVEFFKDGSLKSVEGKSRLPVGIVPARIAGYVNGNYKRSYITEYKVKTGAQEVELADGTELKFDAAGNFLKSDTN